MLQEKIQNDLKEAMKAGEAERPRLSLLRGLSAALHNEEIKRRGSGKEESLSEEEVTQTLQREAKKRKEAAELFRSGNRPELAEKEEKEFQMIQEYLPKQLSKEEVKETVDRLYGAGNKEFNTLIKAAMAELKGKADGGTVSALIKEKLGQ
jgi:uncharacterized protein YqeY